MKHNVLFALFILVAISTSCTKTVAPLPPVNVPSGYFAGEFKLLHRHTDKVPFDSLVANIQVRLNTGDFTYTVTGDTVNVHAGSNGTFGLSSPYLIFNDKTYILGAIPTKTHLNGYYAYNFDGKVLKMLAYSSDTLALEYNLTKTGN